jgi:hypothetical protein
MKPVPTDARRVDSSGRGIGARLASLVDEQYALFVELDAACDRQASLIETDASEALLAHLEARKQLVERIVHVSGELEPYRARWDSLVPLLPSAQMESLQSRLDEIAVLATRVRERDEDARRRLQGKREALGLELSGVERARNAGNAYARRSIGTPRLQDREA